MRSEELEEIVKQFVLNPRRFFDEHQADPATAMFRLVSAILLSLVIFGVAAGAFYSVIDQNIGLVWISLVVSVPGIILLTAFKLSSLCLGTVIIGDSSLKKTFSIAAVTLSAALLTFSGFLLIGTVIGLRSYILPLPTGATLTDTSATLLLKQTVYAASVIPLLYMTVLDYIALRTVHNLSKVRSIIPVLVSQSLLVGAGAFLIAYAEVIMYLLAVIFTLALSNRPI